MLEHVRQDTLHTLHTLDIIGVCEMYIKLNCLKRKKINCLVLRGNKVDREILISYNTLLKWDMIHPTFGKETVTNFVKNAAIKRIQNKQVEIYKYFAFRAVPKTSHYNTLHIITTQTT